MKIQKKKKIRKKNYSIKKEEKKDELFEKIKNTYVLVFTHNFSFFITLLYI